MDRRHVGAEVSPDDLARVAKQQRIVSPVVVKAEAVEDRAAVRVRKQNPIVRDLCFGGPDPRLNPPPPRPPAPVPREDPPGV